MGKKGCQDILPPVWDLQRKGHILSQKVYKYKARLDIHSGRQMHGVNYWEIYSPVVNWFSTRLCLILTLIFSWSTRQIDFFVLAFPQADADVTCSCNFPEVFSLRKFIDQRTV
jgi:hypothetical protein